MITQRDLALVYINDHPGATSIDVANDRPVDNVVYGRQRAASSSIAVLRREGLIEDVENRCEHCGLARTRGTRNVPLYATAKGKHRVAKLKANT